jgi:G3E family GTPase
MTNSQRDDTKSIWIISGFLGSGKTTILNRLLQELAPMPIGVLVNDFGRLGVDRHLIKAAETDTVMELNGGQIFCSCISGNFVDALTAVAESPAKAIVVEASGMAKPGAMTPILEAAVSRSGHRLVYSGMITAVDASRFAKLRSVVNAVDEQIVYADLLVINKKDTVSRDEIDSIRRTLRELNPRARMVSVSFGAVKTEMLPGATEMPGQRSGPEGKSYRGWDGRKPKDVTWSPPRDITKEQLRAELNSRAEETLRIKGFLETAEGPVFVSAVGSAIEITDIDTIPGEPGLTEFYPVHGSSAGRPGVTGDLGMLHTEGESCRTE